MSECSVRLTTGAEWFPSSDMAELGPLAESIFAGTLPATSRGIQRPRRDDWFRTKTIREVVHPKLSVLAVNNDQAIGYVLVGAPLSLPGVARTAGIGLLPHARAKGLGSAMLEKAVAVAHSFGLRTMQILTEDSYLGWYQQHSFLAHRRQHTLIAFGRAEPPTQLMWGSFLDDFQLSEDSAYCNWLHEAWEGTPAKLRLTLTTHAEGIGPIHAWVSQEGSALLVHRVEAPQTSKPRGMTVNVFAALLRALPHGKPVLLVGCDAAESYTHLLLEDEWAIAQTSTIMVRRLGGE